MEKTGERIVLCGANAYEQKYYYNETFNAIPASIKTDAYEEDILYDEISSGLLVREIRMQRRELLESLSLYYRVFVLHEPVDELM